MSTVTFPPQPHIDGEQASASTSTRTFERRLGDSEASYFLPARADGVNDMYLRISFTAPPGLLTLERAHTAWAIIRLRNPLLASKVILKTYEDVRFTYDAPVSPNDALREAASAFEFRNETKQGVIDRYLNGPRTLSGERVSYLILSSTTPPDEATKGSREFGLTLCTVHCLSDGIAMHRTMNQFFSLVGSNKSSDELQHTLIEEWESRWGKSSRVNVNPLPAAMEDRLNAPAGRLRRAAALVDFQNTQHKLIGGHTLPRINAGARKTITYEASFDEEQTKVIVRKCKANGVSVGHALFALCNIAMIRAMGGMSPELPMMIYTALNLRPKLNPAHPSKSSHHFLTIGYHNVVLPSFLPTTTKTTHAQTQTRTRTKAHSYTGRNANVGATEKTFWLRAQSAKRQMTEYLKSDMLAARALEMAKERGRRARMWAAEDDGVAAPAPASTPSPSSSLAASAFSPSSFSSAPAPASPTLLPPAPSVAIIGLSLLGDLDALYDYSAFPSIHIRGCLCGSRQRKGASLIFAQTLAGRFHMSLGWDSNGLEPDVVNAFWHGLKSGVHEFVLPGSEMSSARL